MKAAEYIAANLRLTPVAGLDLSLYLAHPGSGLSRLNRAAPPYWAYAWAGGLALAHHLRACPGAVRGKAVIDLGAGSGLVAIAAALAGARSVLAVEPDAWGCAAVTLNAATNDVTVAVARKLPDPLPPDAVILAGDVFYAPKVARAMTALLARADLPVLIGDPGRADLPSGLTLIAEYPVPDVGNAPDRPLSRGMVLVRA